MNQPCTAMPDNELLRRFVQHRDQTAFREIVARHGPLVLSVCRSVLGNEADAEDVFQATFLQLIQRAAQGRWQSSIAGWLYKVAHHAAVRLKQQQARKREAELFEDSLEDPRELPRVARRHTEQALYEALGELPSDYREAIVLCHLQGKSREEAAAELNCTTTVIKGRLQRGKQQLLVRLGRRGVTLSAALWVCQESVHACELPAGLAESTLEAGLTQLAGGLNSVSDSTHLFTQGEAMISSSVLKVLAIGSLAVAMTLLGGLAASGTGLSPFSTTTSGAGLVAFLDDEGEEAQQSIELDLDLSENESRPAQEDQENEEAIQRQAVAERKLKAALNAKTDLDFQNAPLQDVVDYLRSKHNLQMVFDHNALEAEGVAPDVPVTAKLQGVSLRSALSFILSPNRLDYRLDDSMLVITTKPEAVYPQLHEVDELVHGDGAEDLEALQAVIMAGIAAKSWKNEENPDGYTSITPFRGNGLLIVQSEAVHLKIAAFLEKLEEEYEEEEEDEEHEERRARQGAEDGEGEERRANNDEQGEERQEPRRVEDEEGEERAPARPTVSDNEGEEG